MNILLCAYILALPYVIDAESVCSDGKGCPEGTKCCTTHEGVIRCCDIDDTFSEYVKTKKALQVVPSNPPHLFTNGSNPLNVYGYCYEDINCRSGTCCSSNCCPYKYAECCKTGCCKFLQKCCGPVEEGGDEWCCDSSDRCSWYTEGLCVDKSSSLVPQFIIMLSVATVRVWLLKLFG
ncbi:unnamed protein product [Larinioides sclopetarius]|uniref:Granulin n=1 Tax=Larinioides sclopetarius TaxID=280406 RepID=A0AAV2AYV9_9ARAC